MWPSAHQAGEADDLPTWKCLQAATAIHMSQASPPPWTDGDDPSPPQEGDLNHAGAQVEAFQTGSIHRDSLDMAEVACFPTPSNEPLELRSKLDRLFDHFWNAVCANMPHYNRVNTGIDSQH
ncbi:Hypothetical predicted protein [Pelobates cultripes]|uniref:Uncharacterized protein n=1 Tax=Pelobates cultripes TaxID=61616 RepID=A0AAD1WKE7_PELCU|nr:Hypothetical predicted protein [Pelobates cultripes]